MAEMLTTTDYNEISEYVAQHAPSARILEEITAHLDADYHTVWLDNWTVWHAWSEPGEDEWHLDQETAERALKWLQSQLDGAGVFDRLADPTRYAEAVEARYVASDEDAMAEYYDVELAAIRCILPDNSPAHDVDRVIQNQINLARAEAARLASLRAHHIRAAFQGDGERGWKSAAARGLGITPVSLGDVLKDDDARAERRRQEAARSRDDFDG
ncbi:hypothetical protein ABZ897_01025 [Nonomuraea sp. NPDC046802]|uniref:hypothetical protein n=1 Tax=Nonomuraea sp. NPDC046802 TaxID=3154919 RepID=UPI003407637E